MPYYRSRAGSDRYLAGGAGYGMPAKRARFSLAPRGVARLRPNANRLRRAGGRLSVGTGRTRYVRTVRDTPIFAPRFPTAKQEMKYTDIDIAQYVISTAPVIVHLNRIGLGGSIDGFREGTRVKLLSCMVRGFLFQAANATAGTAHTGVIMVVWDRNPGGALPNWNDVMESQTVSSFQNTQNRDRFRILGRWEMGFVTSAAANTAPRPFNQKLDFSLENTWNQGGSGAISDIITGGLYLLLLGDQAPAPGVSPFATLQVRTLYADQ